MCRTYRPLNKYFASPRERQSRCGRGLYDRRGMCEVYAGSWKPSESGILTKMPCLWFTAWKLLGIVRSRGRGLSSTKEICPFLYEGLTSQGGSRGRASHPSCCRTYDIVVCWFIFLVFDTSHLNARYHAYLS